MTTPPLTGGCQCGAVRFAVAGEVGRGGICHCRMCQKATGGGFGAFVGPVQGLAWTRGEPAWFQSSNKARRGFCAACGTPLIFEWDHEMSEIAIGAFDEPAAIRPDIQLATESRLPWFAELAALPERAPQYAPSRDRVVSNQHPDHDTRRWPAP